MKLATLSLLLFPLAACGGDDAGGAGTVQVLLEAEDTIPDGLVAGTGEEDIVDGWDVTYTRYTVAFGNVTASRSADPDGALEDPAVRVIDLRSVPATGTVTATFEDVVADRFDVVGFELPVATAAATRDASVPQADFDTMVADGLSQWVSGTATMGAESIDFDFRITGGVAFEHCGPEEGDTGFAVPDGGTTQAAFTIHGDHFWFNAFPEGFEGTIERRAGWLALADADADGTLTAAELDAATAATLFPAPTYSLGGGPIPVTNGATWVRAQAYTTGHFAGEGECEWAVQ
jgi:hypothetical protein